MLETFLESNFGKIDLSSLFRSFESISGLLSQAFQENDESVEWKKISDRNPEEPVSSPPLSLCKGIQASLGQAIEEMYECLQQMYTHDLFFKIDLPPVTKEALKTLVESVCMHACDHLPHVMKQNLVFTRCVFAAIGFSQASAFSPDAPSIVDIVGGSVTARKAVIQIEPCASAEDQYAKVSQHLEKIHHRIEMRINKLVFNLGGGAVYHSVPRMKRVYNIMEDVTLFIQDTSQFFAGMQYFANPVRNDLVTQEANDLSFCVQRIKGLSKQWMKQVIRSCFRLSSEEAPRSTLADSETATSERREEDITKEKEKKKKKKRGWDLQQVKEGVRSLWNRVVSPSGPSSSANGKPSNSVSSPADQTSKKMWEDRINGIFGNEQPISGSQSKTDAGDTPEGRLPPGSGSEGETRQIMSAQTTHLLLYIHALHTVTNDVSDLTEQQSSSSSSSSSTSTSSSSRARARGEESTERDARNRQIPNLPSHDSIHFTPLMLTFVKDLLCFFGDAAQCCTFNVFDDATIVSHSSLSTNAPFVTYLLKDLYVATILCNRYLNESFRYFLHEVSALAIDVGRDFQGTVSLHWFKQVRRDLNSAGIPKELEGIDSLFVSRPVLSVLQQKRTRVFMTQDSRTEPSTGTVVPRKEITWEVPQPIPARPPVARGSDSPSGTLLIQPMSSDAMQLLLTETSASTSDTTSRPRTDLRDVVSLTDPRMYTTNAQRMVLYMLGNSLIATMKLLKMSNTLFKSFVDLRNSKDHSW